ncbi:class I SAM-dependent methyltransferase [Candidatus Aenigmatarchaeota archaeon]
MDVKEALEKFSEYYDHRNDVEFPTIFSMCDFTDKRVAEIGAGHQGHFIKELLNKTKSITAVDIDEKALEKLKKRINNDMVCYMKAPAEDLPFEDNSQDIVFSRWTIHEFDVDSAILEFCRVAKKHVFIVLPSEEGDETEMKNLKEDSSDKRKQRIDKIKALMEHNGLSVKEERKLLSFTFPSMEEAFEILHAVAFGHGLAEETKEVVKSFLLSRKDGDKIKFTQGASFILGTKK